MNSFHLGVRSSRRDNPVLDVLVVAEETGHWRCAGSGSRRSLLFRHELLTPAILDIRALSELRVHVIAAARRRFRPGVGRIRTEDVSLAKPHLQVLPRRRHRKSFFEVRPRDAEAGEQRLGPAHEQAAVGLHQLPGGHAHGHRVDLIDGLLAAALHRDLFDRRVDVGPRQLQAAVLHGCSGGSSVISRGRGPERGAVIDERRAAGNIRRRSRDLLALVEPRTLSYAVDRRCRNEIPAGQLAHLVLATHWRVVALTCRWIDLVDASTTRRLVGQRHRPDIRDRGLAPVESELGIRRLGPAAVWQAPRCPPACWPRPPAQEPPAMPMP